MQLKKVTSLYIAPSAISVFTVYSNPLGQLCLSIPGAGAVDVPKDTQLLISIKPESDGVTCLRVMKVT